jgi:hypothetical protein
MQLSNYRDLGSVGAYPKWVRNLKGYSGVYVVRCRRTKKTLYVGYSGSRKLYETMTCHFQTVGRWYGPTGDERPAYSRGSVEVAVLKLGNGSEASILEQHYICELDPRDNTYSRNECDEVPF